MISLFGCSNLGGGNLLLKLPGKFSLRQSFTSKIPYFLVGFPGGTLQGGKIQGFKTAPI